MRRWESIGMDCWCFHFLIECQNPARSKLSARKQSIWTMIQDYKIFSRTSAKKISIFSFPAREKWHKRCERTKQKKGWFLCFHLMNKNVPLVFVTLQKNKFSYFDIFFHYRNLSPFSSFMYTYIHKVIYFWIFFYCVVVPSRTFLHSRYYIHYNKQWCIWKPLTPIISLKFSFIITGYIK